MNNKVTEEMKVKIKQMRSDGLTFEKIGEKFGISISTVAYHSDEKHKKKCIARAIKNRKPRDRTEYNRKYQAERYKNDPEFREKQKKASLENWRKKSGTK